MEIHWNPLILKNPSTLFIQLKFLFKISIDTHLKYNRWDNKEIYEVTVKIRQYEINQDVLYSTIITNTIHLYFKCN